MNSKSYPMLNIFWFLKMLIDYVSIMEMKLLTAIHLPEMFSNWPEINCIP